MLKVYDNGDYNNDGQQIMLIWTFGSVGQNNISSTFKNQSAEVLFKSPFLAESELF